MKRKEVIYEFGSFIIFNFIYLHCSLTHPYWNNQENRDWNHSYFLLYLNGWSLSAAVFFSQLEIFLFLISVWYLHTWLSPTYSSVGDIFALSWMLLQKNWMQGLIFFFFNYVNFIIIWILHFTCLVSIYANLEQTRYLRYIVLCHPFSTSMPTPQLNKDKCRLIFFYLMYF